MWQVEVVSYRLSVSTPRKRRKKKEPASISADKTIEQYCFLILHEPPQMGA